MPIVSQPPPPPRGSRRNERSFMVSRRVGFRMVGFVVIVFSFVVYIKDWNLTGSMMIRGGGGGMDTTTASTVVKPTPPSQNMINHTNGTNYKNNKNNNKNNKPQDSTSREKGWNEIDPFAEQPACLLLANLAGAGEPSDHLTMRHILQGYGKYVPVEQDASVAGHNHNSYALPRYDHQSCFLMRPRYNCARNTAETNNTALKVATDYALVLQDSALETRSRNSSNNDNDALRNSNRTSSVCDLQKFVHDAGGPAGVGQRMLQNYRNRRRRTLANDVPSSTDNDRAPPGEKTLVEVLLVGTSRFRQIFEALVCGFSDQLVDLRLQLGGPVFNVHHKYMNTDEIGPLVDLGFVRNGSCYRPEAQADLSAFFRKDGTIVPRNHDRCNDNIGMVEFGGSDNTSSIRFYTVFRPWAWTNITPALEKLGIEDEHHKLDFVLWEPRDESDAASWQYSSSSDLESLYREIFDVRTTSSVRDHRSSSSSSSSLYIEQHDAHGLYRAIQERDIGRYFGADNPWITNPPDAEHPCMPGMPDDKVNFLLWYMLSLSAMEEQ